MSRSVLSLAGFGVAFGEKVVLGAVDLEVPDRRITVLLGPSGTGKSTLVRSLAGFNDANPSLRLWGEVEYLGKALGDGERPALVCQSARLMLASVLENIVHALPERNSLTIAQQRELAQRLLHHAGLDELQRSLDEPVIHLGLAQQRHLAIMRQAAAGPRLLCMDEPTTGLTGAESERLLDYIREESRHRAMLVVLHNLAHARRLGGMTALLAGGRIQEAGGCDAFFDAPRTEAGKIFLRTGNCALPAPDAPPETLDAAVAAPPPMPAVATEYISDSFGPRGFLWLKKGQLAGTPRPGIVHDIEYDLKALQRVGVTCLVSLTQREPDVAEMERFGIDNIWSPIPDMEPPSATQALLLCQQIHALLEQGEVVAVHCRAGLGRTGTLLASYLIWEGDDALGALERVRRIEPRWVQSTEQAAFLEQFEMLLAESAAVLQGTKSRMSNDFFTPTTVKKGKNHVRSR